MMNINTEATIDIIITIFFGKTFFFSHYITKKIVYIYFLENGCRINRNVINVKTATKRVLFLITREKIKIN